MRRSSGSTRAYDRWYVQTDPEYRLVAPLSAHTGPHFEGVRAGAAVQSADHHFCFFKQTHRRLVAGFGLARCRFS